MQNKQNWEIEAELTLGVGKVILAKAKRMELLSQIGLTENLTRAAKIESYSHKGTW